MNVGGVLTLKLDGEFTFREQQQFSQAVTNVLDNEWSEIKVDFAGVSYLDSSALGMLLLMRHRVTAKDRRVSLINCNAAVKSIMDISNFHKLFDIT